MFASTNKNRKQNLTFRGYNIILQHCSFEVLCVQGNPRWLGAVARKIAANLGGTSQDASVFLYVQ